MEQGRTEQSKKSRLERGQSLRNALDAVGSTKLSLEDRKAVATALRRLLDRVEKQFQISKASVLEKANIGGAGSSTKYLSYHAILPGKNADSLRKKVQGYVKIAKKAAELAVLDETKVLLEVFGQASFWQSSNARETEPKFHELADRLKTVLNAISTKRNLARFFREVANGGGVLTPCLGSYQSDQGTAETVIEFYFGDRQAWPIEFYQATWEVEDGDGYHIPAYPSLILGTWALDRPFEVNVSANLAVEAGQTIRVAGKVRGQVHSKPKALYRSSRYRT